MTKVTSETLTVNKIKEVYLIPMTHLDIGFTDTLDSVAMRYKDDIDQAIKLCDTYDEFYYTIESLWQLEQWLLRSKQDEIGRLQSLVDSGRIEVAAMYGTLRSGLLGIEDSNRLLYPMQRMREKLKFTCETAIQNDVPGYVEVFPRVLASAGIKYFLTGVNTGHGGGVHIPRSNQPFLWQSDDGQSVLTWIDHDGYASVWFWHVFNIWIGTREAVLAESGKNFFTSLKNLGDSGYPYDVFMLMAALGDNKSPDHYIPLIDGVKEWNESGRNPVFRFATPSQFFRMIEQQQAKRKFPEYKGNWHGLWDARLWNPAGNTLARYAQQMLPAAETLFSFNRLHGIGTYYQYDFTEGEMSLYSHIEHSSGGDPSWIGFFNPSLFKKTAIYQNDLTIRYAKDARYAAERLIDAGLSDLAKRINMKCDGIILFNSLQWQRDSIVSCAIPLNKKEKRFALIDTVTNKAIPYVLDDNGSNMTFLAGGLPAFGYKCYLFEYDEQINSDAKYSTTREWDYILENQFYRIKCEPQQGYITSITDLETGRELIGVYYGPPMNSLIQTNHLDTIQPGFGEFLSIPTIVSKEKNTFQERLVVKRADSLWPLTTITLTDKVKRIDIRHILDRKRFPDVSKERHSLHYSFAFPFNLDEKNMRIYIDGADGFFEYPEDYLPGATLGAVQSQFGIHLQEGEAFGITVANRQSFNWTVGDINYNRKATHVDEPPLMIIHNPNHVPSSSVNPLSAKLYSNVIQFATEGWTADYGRTRIRETEPGTDDRMIFEYSITTYGGPFSKQAATRFCRETVILPLAHYMREWLSGNRTSLPFVCPSFIHITPENVLVTAFKKAEFGSTEDYILRIKELEGKETSAAIQLQRAVAEAALCSLNEVSGEKVELLSDTTIQVDMAPYQVATVRLQFK